MVAMDLKSGEILWTHRTRYADPSERVKCAATDAGWVGVCSSPVIIGDRLYYVAPHGVVYCLDTNGFHDDEDDGAKDTMDIDAGDVVFEFDLKSLGMRSYHYWGSSPATDGKLLYISTSPGSYTRQHSEVPGLIAIDVKTGKCVWQFRAASKSGARCQLASPSVASIGRRTQVIFAGGDGWVYSFDADSIAKGETKELWRFDACQGRGSTRLNIVASPVIHEGKVLIATASRIPFLDNSPGVLWCIDGSRRGHLSNVPDAKGDNSGVLWKVSLENEIIANPVVHDGLAYVVDTEGQMACIRVDNGSEHWRRRLEQDVWATPLWLADQLLVTGSDGIVFGLKANGIARPVCKMNREVYATPTANGDSLVIASQDTIRCFNCSDPN
ncbi:MAG: PQQ-binding-like beta-propeller repeat protein [Planctomycetales bacterium]|nr:PQQ-binding-like beta-propeller repeat protein [Planctomycetales bacterium]